VRRGFRRQGGQVIVLMALMIIVLTGAVGIGIDAGFGYIYSAACERAAAAAALSGVVFMPDQFDSTKASPAGSRNDATDRAVDEAKKNGFTSSQVSVAAVAGSGNKFSVTVTRTVRTTFMSIFGLSQYNVSRTAVASYLPPLSVGQPGSQIGANVSSLGSTGFYFLRSEGYATSRDQGDAFTPNPATEYNTSLTPASTDVHQISYANSSEPSDATLPDRGGFNFRVTLPAGGRIQVYNAAFAPESTHNFCENAKTGTAGHTCSSGDPYYYHEDDSFGSTPWPSSQYSAMRYTIYQVPNLFIRSSDVKLTQMTVYPIDASNATASPPKYKDIGTGATITQTYDAAGNPTNMKIYHSWIDPATYTEAGAGDLVVYNASYGAYSGTLPAGTYRLRVDTLEWNGAIPNASGTSIAHKGYAVRAVDTTGALCAACSVGAWNDTTVYTPVVGGTFSVPVLSVPPDYAGQTITFDIFDPGDLSVGSNLTLSILTPTGAIASAAAPFQVKIYDLGTQRSNLESATVCALADPISNPPCLAASGANATIVSTSGGTKYFNGHWLHFLLPIPASYAPGPDPNNWWYKLQYTTAAGTTANDTFSMAVGFKGNPAHVVTS
jgi:hypothetical protein